MHRSENPTQQCTRNINKSELSPWQESACAMQTTETFLQKIRARLLAFHGGLRKHFIIFPHSTHMNETRTWSCTKKNPSRNSDLKTLSIHPLAYALGSRNRIDPYSLVAWYMTRGYQSPHTQAKFKKLPKALNHLSIGEHVCCVHVVWLMHQLSQNVNQYSHVWKLDQVQSYTSRRQNKTRANQCTAHSQSLLILTQRCSWVYTKRVDTIAQLVSQQPANSNKLQNSYWIHLL